MFLKRAIEFLDLAKRHAEDGDVRGAIELTDGALEWLKIAERPGSTCAACGSVSAEGCPACN